MWHRFTLHINNKLINAKPIVNIYWIFVYTLREFGRDCVLENVRLAGAPLGASEALSQNRRASVTPVYICIWWRGPCCTHIHRQLYTAPPSEFLSLCFSHTPKHTSSTKINSSTRVSIICCPSATRRRPPTLRTISPVVVGVHLNPH